MIPASRTDPASRPPRPRVTAPLAPQLRRRRRTLGSSAIRTRASRSRTASFSSTLATSAAWTSTPETPARPSTNCTAPSDASTASSRSALATRGLNPRPTGSPVSSRSWATTASASTRPSCGSRPATWTSHRSLGRMVSLPHPSGPPHLRPSTPTRHRPSKMATATSGASSS